MKRILLVLLVAACFSATAQANNTFKIDPSRSTIAFKVRHLLGNAKGTFSKFAGTIEVDREHPEQSSVAVTIQAASIDTANAKRDEHLRNPDFFNVAKFPQITFKSRGVKQTGRTSGDINGDLTMHGVTRPITLRVQLLGPQEIADAERTRWRVNASLKRSDFQIGEGAGGASMIANDVAIEMEIEAVRAK